MFLASIVEKDDASTVASEMIKKDNHDNHDNHNDNHNNNNNDNNIEAISMEAIELSLC